MCSRVGSLCSGVGLIHVDQNVLSGGAHRSRCAWGWAHRLRCAWGWGSQIKMCLWVGLIDQVLRGAAYSRVLSIDKASCQSLLQHRLVVELCTV